jgi:hypothetical protein
MGQLVDFFKGLLKFVKILINIIIILILLMVLSLFIPFAIFTSPLGLIQWSLFTFYYNTFFRITGMIINRMNNLC